MKPVFVEDPLFLSIFLHICGSDFAHAHGIPASVTDQGTNSEEYTKFEHVIFGFASSKFPSVIILARLLFRLTISIFGSVVHNSTSHDTAACSGQLQLRN